jgi:hypothetical protein
MDQRSILSRFARKGLAAVVIYKDLVAALGAEAISDPLVMRCLQEAKFATSNLEVTFSEPIQEYNDGDQATLPTLDEQPFASIRQLARLIHLPRTTRPRRLTESLEFQVCHVRWVPYQLSDAQRSNRIEFSQALPSVLRTQQR